MTCLYCWVLIITGCCCSVAQEISNSMTDLQCSEGSNVRFEIPCPDDFVNSRFKKFFEGDFIVSDGVLRDEGGTRYELDEDKTHITLKECNEDDEGIYIWLCSTNNEVKHFNLEIRRQSDADLVCFKGHHISFENPCPLPEQYEKCRFKKRFQQEYIILDGVLNDHRFEWDVSKTRITLKECDEDDEATYVLICEGCAIEQRFYLEVQDHTD